MKVQASSSSTLYQAKASASKSLASEKIQTESSDSKRTLSDTFVDNAYPLVETLVNGVGIAVAQNSTGAVAAVTGGLSTIRAGVRSANASDLAYTARVSEAKGDVGKAERYSKLLSKERMGAWGSGLQALASFTAVGGAPLGASLVILGAGALLNFGSANVYSEL